MKQEWRKIINVHPAALYKSDLIELVKILTEGDNNRRCDLSINIGYGGFTQTLTSIAEVESYSKHTPTNELSMRVTTWDEKNNVINGVSLTMYRNFIDYQIHSDSEAWFLGKIAQLRNFFKTRKPWYSIINRVIPFVGPALVISGFYLSLSAIKNGALISAVLGVSLTVLMAIISYCSFRGKLFPYVRIYPYDKGGTIFTYELISTIIALLALGVSIFGTIIVPLIQKGH
jgi:hypothetical protein